MSGLPNILISNTDLAVLKAANEELLSGPASYIGNILFQEPRGKKQGRTQQGMALCGMKAVRNAEKKGLVTVSSLRFGYQARITELGKNVLLQVAHGNFQS